MRKIKVLKLGWEFPPLINGGLGVACMGISRALASKVELSVIVPKAAPEAAYDGFSSPALTPQTRANGNARRGIYIREFLRGRQSSD